MGRKASGTSARSKIREFLETLPIGGKFTSRDLQALTGIQEFARRLRELRQEEGYVVVGYKDQPDLKQDEYRYLGKEAAQPLKTKVPAEITRKLRRERPYCQLCGRGEGALVPGSLYRRVKLHVHHFRPQARDGGSDEKNLMVLCSFCNEGLSDLTQVQAFIRGDDLLATLRNSTRADKAQTFSALAQWLRDNPDPK